MTGPHRQLLSAAVLTAAAVTATCAVPRLLGGADPAWSVPVSVDAVLLVAGVGAGALPWARRRSERLLMIAADLACLAGIAALGLVAAIAVLGHRPLDGGDDFTGPVLIATALAAITATRARTRATNVVLDVVRGARYEPEDVLRRFGEDASRGADLDETLSGLGEALRRSLSLQRVEIWTGAAGRLTAAVVLPEGSGGLPGNDPATDPGTPGTSVTPSTSVAPGASGTDAARSGPSGGYGEDIRLVEVGSTITLTVSDRVALSRTRVAGPGWLSLWVPVLARMHEHAQLRVIPARAGGALLGMIVVRRPLEAPRFSEPEDRMLAELGTRLGTVLHNRQLDANLRDALADLRHANDELRVSRARLVATADAERRRIERDLHDGAQQQLVSLAVGLRLVRDLVADSADSTDGADGATGTGTDADSAENAARRNEDVAAADELLAAMAEQVAETITEVRNLAHGIYPPLLRSSGLTEALRAAGQRSTVGVTVRADEIGRYPADIEAAVYFCCLEALQNAAKHAAECSVELVLAEREGALTFSVQDNGAGFDPRRLERGHGMTNMADRIGAIGGTLRWESALGAGTQVHGVVPVSIFRGDAGDGSWQPADLRGSTAPGQSTDPARAGGSERPGGSVRPGDSAGHPESAVPR
ncbi:Histidine kinase-, DNA gyrase B-, and HSP90-like ATPase [Parafrankia irregularis]|uniref:histidine kinase n=1 Tax=Parafrankia irregularis TaxID=795642 RepID=A0A0S4QXG2_9ACTN|nr:MULTISPECIES: histidine kinase [Parafrankia]MBE3203446.1 sensor histidine kinase [Parafrankia sp. CH37]CUU60195.1 Histidine kinase-, DNA gyrase B-, and HSP90-like ATPase [Parafrankia irregularis]